MSWNDGKEIVRVCGLMLFCVTDFALQVGEPDCEEDERVWLPLSQVDQTDLDYEGDDCLYTEGFVDIPRWLAEKRNLRW